MKFLQKSKDGGPESKVTGYWLIELKGLFSVVLLHFGPGSREAYHSHAFNCISWLLKGKLEEHELSGAVTTYRPSLWPITTLCKRFHQVQSLGDSWALSFRGPWRSTWREYLPNEGRFVTLTHGRREV